MTSTGQEIFCDQTSKRGGSTVLLTPLVFCRFQSDHGGLGSSGDHSTTTQESTPHRSLGTAHLRSNTWTPETCRPVGLPMYRRPGTHVTQPLDLPAVSVTHDLPDVVGRAGDPVRTRPSPTKKSGSTHDACRRRGTCRPVGPLLTSTDFVGTDS